MLSRASVGLKDYKLKYGVIIPGSNPFFNLFNPAAIDPDIHPTKVVKTLLFWKTEIGPPY
jgi:hypothetical protein